VARPGCRARPPATTPDRRDDRLEVGELREDLAREQTAFAGDDVVVVAVTSNSTVLSLIAIAIAIAIAIGDGGVAQARARCSTTSYWRPPAVGACTGIRLAPVWHD
jgi:hypothetical protein